MTAFSRNRRLAGSTALVGAAAREDSTVYAVGEAIKTALVCRRIREHRKDDDRRGTRMASIFGCSEHCAINSFRARAEV